MISVATVIITHKPPIIIASRKNCNPLGISSWELIGQGMRSLLRLDWKDIKERIACKEPGNRFQSFGPATECSTLSLCEAHKEPKCLLVECFFSKWVSVMVNKQADTTATQIIVNNDCRFHKKHLDTKCSAMHLHLPKGQFKWQRFSL